MKTAIIDLLIAVCSCGVPVSRCADRYIGTEGVGEGGFGLQAIVITHQYFWFVITESDQLKTE